VTTDQNYTNIQTYMADALWGQIIYLAPKCLLLHTLSETYTINCCIFVVSNNACYSWVLFIRPLWIARWSF